MNPWGVLRHFSELNMHIGVVLYCGIFISLMAHPSSVLHSECRIGGSSSDNPVRRARREILVGGALTGTALEEGGGQSRSDLILASNIRLM